ncbi:spindle assembly checkpoint kinase [Bulinus truncatus]|nr:spindle assembly checkpoint kinase [Bulinus truncatus]
MFRNLNDASDSQVFDIVTYTDFSDVFSLQENPVLGVGLSFTVIRASITDDPTFTIRAVKQFALHCQGSKPDYDQKVLKKFSREVKAMKMARHPRIMSLFASVRTSDCLAIVMPFYKNGTLMSSITTLTTYQQLKYGRQMCQAVKFLQDKNIVHLDIKPDNIMLDNNGDIILSDFGFARHVPNKHVELLITCGTEDYMAPETQNDEKVDMYALGVTLWCIMLKKPPYYCMNLIKELKRTPDVPKNYRRVITAMLDVDPCNRPSLSNLQQKIRE